MASPRKARRKTVRINDPKTAKLRSRKRRKNFLLDQAKIDRAKAVFGVTTETEAIDRALDVANDLARFRTEVDGGLSGLIGKGGFTDHFPPSVPDVP